MIPLMLWRLRKPKPFPPQSSDLLGLFLPTWDKSGGCKTSELPPLYQRVSPVLTGLSPPSRASLQHTSSLASSHLPLPCPLSSSADDWIQQASLSALETFPTRGRLSSACALHPSQAFRPYDFSAASAPLTSIRPHPLRGYPPALFTTLNHSRVDVMRSGPTLWPLLSSSWPSHSIILPRSFFHTLRTLGVAALSLWVSLWLPFTLTIRQQVLLSTTLITPSSLCLHHTSWQAPSK